MKTGSEMPHHYPAEVFWSDDDEGFIAIARDLPGCSAFGETRLEALDELEHAIHAWIQSAEAAGNPVPAPSVRQAEPRHSGKLLVRLPKTLHSKLAEEAEREAVSLNQYVVWRLSENSCAHSFQNAAMGAINSAVDAAITAIVRVDRHHGLQCTPRAVNTSRRTPFDFARLSESKQVVASQPLAFMLFAPQLEAGHG